MFYTYNGTEFSAVPFAKCSSCGQLIKLEIKNETVLTNSRKCPFCKIELEEVEITSSFAQSLITTAGLQAAGKVLGFDAALFIFFGVVIFEMTVLYFVKDTFSYFPHFIFGFTVIYFLTGFNLSNKWLKDFGTFEVNDEDFNSAKKNIKLSRLVWTAAFVLNLSMWLVYLTLF